MCVCMAICHRFFLWKLYHVRLRTEILISTSVIIQKLETNTKKIKVLSRKSMCLLDDILLCVLAKRITKDDCHNIKYI